MKKGILVTLMAAITAVAVSFAPTLKSSAAGNTDYQDGWTVVCPEGEEELFTFDKNGNLSYIDAGSGSYDLQRVSNFALVNGSYAATDRYSVRATFTPDEGMSNPGKDITYGIVPWYIDADNFIVFWLQQKYTNGKGDFSSQMYGRIGGQFRSFALADDASSFKADEYYDFWWDNAEYTPDSIRGQQNALITHEITLACDVENVTHTGTGQAAKKFTMHVIAPDEDDTNVDEKAFSMWISGATEQSGMVTGVYAQGFTVNVSDFSSTKASDAEVVAAFEGKIAALPEASAITLENKVACESAAADLTAMDMRVRLQVSTASVQKLRDIESKLVQLADQAAADAVTQKITALPETSALTLENKTAVTEAEAAYEALSAAQKALVPSASVEKLNAAKQKIAELEEPEEPESSPSPSADPSADPSEKPSADPAKSGCGCGTIGGFFTGGGGMGLGILLLAVTGAVIWIKYTLTRKSRAVKQN